MTDKRIRCDSCGAPAKPVDYDFVRESDGIGGTDWNSKTIDLCHEHTIERLRKFLEEPPKAPAECQKRAFSAWAKGQKWEPRS